MTYKLQHLEWCENCKSRVFKVDFLEWLRSLTAKPSKQATQREKNIYRHACALLAALEEDKPICADCSCTIQEHKHSWMR